MLLGLLVAVLLGNGLYVWHQRGADDHIGRAVFFGLALFCVYWTAAVYTFKLSLGIHVGPHGLSIVRGPWRTELAWSETGRLVERTEATNGRRYRWVVALAYDGRRLQVREDMVADYQQFRVEVYERYRLWQDHGGTWGTNGGGPFTARDRIGGEVRWWLVGASIFLLPALYFLILLPEVTLAGPVLLLLAILCCVMVARAVLRRQRYTIDSRMMESRRLLRKPLRLGWREIARVERARHAASLLMEVGTVVGRLVMMIAARTDGRARSFAWRPRVPEYLILRGGGRQIRVRLHRLARPDELLAWVEFYERLGRHSATVERQRRPPAPVPSSPLPEPAPADLSGPAGPADPWANGQGGIPATGGTVRSSPHAAAPGNGDDSWLRETHAQPQPREPERHATPGDPSSAYGNPPAQPPRAPTAGQNRPAATPEGAEHPPTDAIAGLADSFAPSRGDSAGRPPLPRFGPPPDEPKPDP